MRILGSRVVRTEDPRLLTGEGHYVDALDLAGALHVTYVRSTVPHALLRSVDVDAARAVPGVVAVLTADDVDIADLPPPMFFPHLDPTKLRPVLARNRVRFVGEAIVAIVSEHPRQGSDAAELVEIDYDPLPVVLDRETSLSNETPLFPESPSNVMAELSTPPIDGLLDGADVVVKQSMVNHRVAPAPMEGRTCAAVWDGERLTYHAACQGVAMLRDLLSGFLGLDPSQVRVISRDVGGGFGAKSLPTAEEILTARLAMQLGRPVRWAETRSENLVAMGHGRGQEQEVEIGATRDGRIVGLRMTILQDGGAYPDIGAGLPAMTMLMASGVYDIPKVEFTSQAYATTTTPTGSYRGAGRPEAAYAIERTMDVLARELDLDPAELRRRNFIGRESFPFTTAVGTTYDCGDYEAALDRALAAADYAGLRAEQAHRRDTGATKQLGIGIACYVEITGAMPGPEPAIVRVNPDGTATVLSGSTPHGQGHETSWAMVASEHLGIPMDRIEVLYGDTDTVPPGGVTGGSRSAQSCGVAVGRASEEVVRAAKERAAALLEAAVEDIVLDEGRFYVAGAPAIAKSWLDVAGNGQDPLQGEAAFEAGGPTFPFGTNIAVVEVDTETGRVEVVRYIACDDAGEILNPLIAEGQIHGGLAMGIAQALIEEIAFDGEGNPLTSTFADYAAVSAPELPSFEIVESVTRTPMNELGAKGIGESGTIGSTPAVVNAVVDALAHLGIRHLDMPATPRRVWEAIGAATA
jgi:carbon-monoxide dehydrogenase large subunit